MAKKCAEQMEKIDERTWLKAVGNVIARGDFFLLPQSISLDYGTDALYDDPVLWHFKIGFSFVCKDEEEKSSLGEQIIAEYNRLMEQKPEVEICPHSIKSKSYKEITGDETR